MANIPKKDKVKVKPNIRVEEWKLIFLKEHIKDTEYNLSTFFDSLLSEYLESIGINYENYKDKI